MKLRRIRAALVVAMLGFFLPNLRADDIDLYSGGEQITGAETNIVIFLDNSANWSNASGWTTTQGEAELAALKTVIDTLNDSVNVGVMMHAQNGSSSGAYVRFAVRPMNPENRAKLKAVFDDIASTAPNAPQDKVSQSQAGDPAIEEVLRYFNSGRDPALALSLGFPAVRDTKADYTNNTDYYQVGGGVSDSLAAKFHPASIIPLPSPTGYAYSSSTATTYQGPANAADGCAKNFLIWIGNTNLAGNTDGTRLSAVAEAAPLSTTANTTQIPALNNTSEAAQPTGVMLDEWGRFMFQKGVKTNIPDPQNDGQFLWNPITTYTVDVFPAAGGTAPQSCTQENAGGAQQIGQHYQMQSLANAGGGECYPATNTTQLEQALKTIFAKIQAVNSVFTSAALPASVNVQGTFENQVYFGIFRPDASARQRWFGNLKAYKFGRYCDANNNNRVDGVPADGAISTCPYPGDSDNDFNPQHTYPIADDERIPECEPNPVCTSGELRLYLADSRNRVATDETTGSGFFDLSAISHWTSNSTFWNFAPVQQAGGSDSPDGPYVERGGAAQKLRASFAGGRTTYTCIEDGCIGGIFDPASPRTLDTLANAGKVTSLLTVADSEEVTLSRTGNTVTAVVADGEHTYTDGALVTIGDVTCESDSTNSCLQYSGLKTIATAGPTSPFTYQITELPPSDNSGSAYYQVNPPVQNISGDITLSSDGTNVTATVTTAAALGLSPGDLVSIAGVQQSFLAGNHTVTNVSGNTFEFQISVLSLPNPPATGTSDGATSSPLTNVTVARGSGSNAHRVSVITTSNLGADYGGGSMVTVGGVDSAAIKGFDGEWLSLGTGTTCGISTNPERNRSWCFNLAGKAIAGGTMTATKVASPQYINLTRVPGSSDFTATLVSGTHALSGGEIVVINGSPVPDYNASWRVATATSGSNNFTVTVKQDGSVLALRPPQPAAAATAQAGVSSGKIIAASNLVNFIRGAEVLEDENRDGQLGVRASIHGDALHSRPLVLNYGGVYGTRIFYGSNDGFLHAIDGGLEDTKGTERWAFMAEEFIDLNKLTRVYANSPLIEFPNLQCGILPEPEPRTYFWDGQISALRSAEVVAYNSSGDLRPDDGATATVNEQRLTNADYPYSRPEKTYIYATMRRGGRSIYALDVSNPNVPKLLWRIKGGTTTGYDQLAQTWSQPKLARIKGTFDNVTYERIVLIFGAGYDPIDEDVKPGAARGDRAGYTGIGRGVYVVDAYTGAKIAFIAAPSALNRHSFAADVSLLDVNGDGYADRIYAVDTGANMYRFDLDETMASAAEVPGTNWTAYRLAELGLDAGQTGANNRKFLFGPSLVPFVKNGLDYVAVMAGTGDREKPLPNRVRNSAGTVVDATLSCSATADRYYDDSYFGTVVNDRFYTVFDQPAVAPTSTFTESDLQHVNQDPSALTPFVFGNGEDGWFISLTNDPDADSASEEKTVNAVLALGSSAFFSTNTPIMPDLSRGQCSALGQARGYAVNILSGMPAFNRDASTDPSDASIQTFTQRDYAATFVNGGLPPTAVYAPTVIAGRVYDVLVGTGGETLGSNTTDPACIENPTLCESTTVLTPLNPDIMIKGQRSKVYWFYNKE